MSTLLTILGWHCIISAALGAGISFKLTGRNVIVATDVLFSLAGIGVLFLLLAGMVG